jgi:AcrR family transcriptional regulator
MQPDRRFVDATARPVIWARLSEQGRGPARLLDYATITATAMAIADEDGLDAVTMRAVAARLGRAPMSLYRHVGNREDLTELMYDAALGELRLDAAGEGWRERLAAQARELRQLYHRHPWIGKLVQRPMLGPNSVRMLEYQLAALDAPGRSIDRIMDAVSTTLQFTAGFVQEELAEQEAHARSGIDAEGWHLYMKNYVIEIIERGENPYFERFIREAEDYPDPDVVFERRLALVLDGVTRVLD